jgi:lipopolysaccharide/colanic/teichoic acid biosynthesis glycosyltransferase
MTGLWQVSGRSNGDLRVQEALDTYYIRNWSLWLDLHILARTIHTVLLGKGAY